ncbi:hypothetical protein FRC08_013794 [Ceratobasidium sp. 394]|nr:hypothetical protein FRC08_013794 [Ceratobasidium sp. 394]
MGKAPKPPRTSHRYSPVPSGPSSKKPDDDDDIKIYDLSSAAGSIPAKLDYSHKSWLNHFIPEFGTKVAKRGSRKANATTWNRDFVLTKFIPHFFGKLALTEGDKEWVCDVLGDKIYNFFANHQKRQTSARAPRAAVKSKRYGHDAYRKAHPEEHDAAVDALVTAEKPELVGTKLTVGKMRHFSSRVFKNLPEDRQEHWRQVAKEELAADQAAATLTDPLARERYTTSLLRTLQVLVNEAGQKANVRLAIQVLSEQGDRRFKLSSLISSNLPNFAKSDAIAVVLNALKDEVEASVEGGEVEGAIPSPDLIIDFANGGHPLLPEIAGMNLTRLRPLIRAYIKALYAKGGGVGKVPWEEIGRSLNDWIDPNRLPPGFEWVDPGSMSMAQILLLCDWILRHQSGDLGPDTALQFLKTNAGSKPIDASISQETSRELVQHRGQKTYFLRFDNFITKCHAVGGIEAMGYSQPAIAYTRFRQTGKLHADTPNSSTSAAAPVPPVEWLGLPFGADVPRSVLFGAEQEVILSLAVMLPQQHRERVENLVRLVNEHQSHLPASNELGAWATPLLPPKIMPSTPFRVPPSPFFAPIWAVCYFKTPSSMEETIFHIESWLGEIRRSGVLVHAPSGSLFGSDTGVVWPIRVLLKVFFNFVGVKYNIQFPDPIPEDCDISRLPLGEWQRLLKQLDDWAQYLRDSIVILQRTSEARALGLHSADDDDIPSHESIARGTTVELPSPAKRRPSKKKAKQTLKELDGSESEALFESEESSSDEDEIDFEVMDKGKGRESDGEESDEEGSDEEMHDGEEKNGSEHEPADGEYSSLTGWFDSPGNGSTGERTSRHPTPGPSNTLFSNTQESAKAQSNLNLRSNSKKPVPDLVPWTKRAHAFGKFIQLPAYRCKDLKSCSMALEMLDAAERAWTNAAGELKLLCNLYNKPLDIDPNELAAVSNTAAPILATYILHRRAAWARAESLAQSLFEIAARILKAFREAIPLHAKINQNIDLLRIRDEARDNCGDQIHTLETRIERSHQLLVEARWTYLELQGFETLATSQLNVLRGNWLAKPLPADLAGLHRLARSQVAWAEAFSKLKASHVDNRRSIWVSVLSLSTFPLRHLTSGMQYAFGNPTSDEEPVGLRDALAQAAAELAGPPPGAPLMLNPDSANMTNIGDVVQDVTMTDAPSSIAATQRDAALERSNAIDEEAAQEPATPPTDATLPITSASSVETTSPTVAAAKPALLEVAPTIPVVPADPVIPTAPAVAAPAIATLPVTAPAVVTTTPAPCATETVLPVPPALPASTAPPSVRSTSPPASPSASERAAQTTTGHKPASRKSGGPSSAVPGDKAEPRQTRCKTRAERAAEAAKEAAAAEAAKEAAAAEAAKEAAAAEAAKKAAAVGKRAKRKSKGRY